MKEEDLDHIVSLDNQLTDNTFKNKHLLTNTHQVLHGINVSTNDGGLTTNLKGCLENFDHAWHDKNAMTNILSMHDVEKHRCNVKHSTKCFM